MVEALLALDAKKGGEYYTRALGAWCCDAENGLSDRVRTRLQECPVDGGTLAALGTWGGNLSTYLTSDDLGDEQPPPFMTAAMPGRLRS